MKAVIIIFFNYNSNLDGVCPEKNLLLLALEIQWL